MKETITLMTIHVMIPSSLLLFSSSLLLFFSTKTAADLTDSKINKEKDKLLPLIVLCV